MTLNNQLEKLETAILQQAQALAENQRQIAQQHCAKILAASTKRLQMWEERETHNAKETAEQVYRRQVQASELKMQAELDRLRWHLVQAVLDKLRHRLTQLCTQPHRYLPLLKQYLAYAAPLLTESKTLVVEVNRRDYEWLQPQWVEITKEISLSTQEYTLLASPRDFIGGLLIRDLADRVRLDNTFEGLINRLENELYQIIVAQLFASTIPLRTV
jgi:V/A-type H+-transporting ATPase subunit E